jgi:hypothetical protein
LFRAAREIDDFESLTRPATADFRRPESRYPAAVKVADQGSHQSGLARAWITRDQYSWR